MAVTYLTSVSLAREPLYLTLTVQRTGVSLTHKLFYLILIGMSLAYTLQIHDSYEVVKRIQRFGSQIHRD